MKSTLRPEYSVPRPITNYYTFTLYLAYVRHAGMVELMKGIATRVWTVGIPVSNFDKALAFYRDLLGFKVQVDARVFNWMELGPDEPLCKVGLFEYKEGYRKPGASTGIVLDTDDIHEFHRRLSSKGVRFTLPPEKQVWGGMQANFEDFDGNKLEVVQDSEHYTRAVPNAEALAR